MLIKNISRIGNDGFSLIEMLATVAIVGIISAIAAPNFLGYFNHNRVIGSISLLNGAIKETQRQAIRLGTQCRVFIDPSTNIINANPPNCLLSERTINNDISIRTNLSGSPPSITFSSKGSTTKSGTIVVSHEATDTQRCFVISLGLGITRTGNYTGAKIGSVSAADCNAN